MIENILRLFIEFFKTGLFSIGGGLATIPFLQKIGESTGWFTNGELLDMIAVSESTPGPIGVNMATYVGFHTAGILGAVVATVALVAPSIVVIIIIAGFLKRFSDNKYVEYVMYGLRAASVALIAAALLSVVEVTLVNMDAFAFSWAGLLAFFNWKALVLAAALYVLMKKTKWHPVFYIAISAVIGIVFNYAGAL